MSEHKALNHAATPKGDTLDSLDTLVAHKDLENRGTSQQPEEVNLAGASIQNTDIIRVSPKQERRKRGDLIPALGSNPTSTQNQEQHRSAPSSKEHGVFKNPLFKYEGGIMNRIISFFANLLKALEQLLLRLVGFRDKSVLFHQPSAQASDPMKNKDREHKEDQEQRRSSRKHNSRTINHSQ